MTPGLLISFFTSLSANRQNLSNSFRFLNQRSFASFQVILASLSLLGIAMTKAQAPSWSNGIIDYGLDSSNVFCAVSHNGDGETIGFWRDGSDTSAVYKLVKWNGSSWNLLSSFTVAASLAGSSSNDDVSLAIDSVGGYHVAFRLNDNSADLVNGRRVIMYGFSANGSTWTFKDVYRTNSSPNGSFNTDDPLVRIDSNNRPHIAFRTSDSSGSRFYAIRHHYFDGTAWTGEQAYGQGGGSGTPNEVTRLSYQIDHNDKSHLAIVVELNGSGTDGSLAYLNNTSGSWSSLNVLATGASGNAAALNVSLVVDSGNKIHIARQDNSRGLYYHTNSSGAFTSARIGTELTGGLDHGSLSINSADHLFLGYNASPTVTNTGAVSYAYLLKDTTSWEAGSVFTGNNNTMRFWSSDLDDDGDATILFDHFSGSGSPGVGNPRQAQYAKASMQALSVVTGPVLESPAVSNIASTSAEIDGLVTAMGGKTAAARGVVYALASSNADPLIGGVSVAQVLESPLGSDTTFRITLSGLNANSPYACKAYVTDTDGVTYYSPVTTFSTNLPPMITSNGGAATASVSVIENSSAVTTFSATDADAGQAVTYSITGGADAALFAIGSATGVLTFAAAPDFEAPADTNADSVYEVIVGATDNGNPPKSATQTLTVTVTNVADNGILAVEQPAGTSLASGSTANFGSITIGQTNELTFTLSSLGEAALLLPSGAVITGAGAPDYSLVSSVPATILIGGSTTLTVRFSPATSGNRLATLSIPTNDTRPGRSPYTITLSGTGLATPTIATYSNAASQVLGGWVNGGNFTIGSVGATNPGNNWPSAESPDKVVDANTGSKFLIFRNSNVGLILKPTNSSLVFNRLSLSTANDFPDRDPASYIIYGSTSNLTGSAGTNIPISNLTEIASGNVTMLSARSAGPTVIQFANHVAYTSYVVVFPTVRNPTGNNLTQISEIQLSQGTNPPLAVAMADARGGQLLSGNFTFGSTGRTEPGTNWDASETPDHTMDGNVNTKFMIFRSTGAGLIASPQAGAARMNTLTLWTANDAAERDPASYEVYGFPTRITQTSGTLAVSGGTLLGSGTLTLPSARNSGPVQVTFNNSTAYASYLVVFPTVKNSPSTNMTQLSELQFSYNGVPDFALSTTTITVIEDSGTYSRTAFATDITPGVGDVGQTVSLSYANDNNALFSAQPSISDDGTLTFTPAANAYGTAVVSVIATDSTGLSNTKTFSIQITSVIDVPVLAAPTVSNISAYSASFLGAVTQNPDSVTIAGNGFIYAPTAAGSTLEYFGAGAVTVRVDDPAFTASAALVLSSSMSYRIRSYCYGPAGMVYSEVTNFTTLQGNAVMLDNTSGLSRSLARTGVSGGPTAGFFLTSPVGSSAQSGWAYRITTGNQAIILNTLTLALNSSGSCTLRIQLYESGGASPEPQGALLFTHTEAARNFGNDGQYATILLSDWSLASNQSYVMKVEAISGSAIWRYYDFYPALNSSAGWSSDKVYMTSGDTMTLANSSLPALQMTGTLVETYTHHELWRFANFGNYASEASGADAADPDGDSLSNLMEYALDIDPNASGVMPASIVLNGANLEYTYIRSTGARENGVTYQIEWSDTLAAGSWSTEAVTEQITSTQGALETVKATIPAGNASRRFLRLRVEAAAVLTP